MARNGADAVGSIVEVQCQYLSASMVCVHVWFDWRGACQPGDSPECGAIRIDIAVADIYRESLNPELFPPSPRFSMLSRLVQQWKHWIFAR